MHLNSTVEETSSVLPHCTAFVVIMHFVCVLHSSSVALMVCKLVLLQVVNYVQKLFMCMVIQDDSKLLSGFPMIGHGNPGSNL
jgi:hypothetical protein